MSLNKIIVMGRHAASKLDLDEPYAVISINDPFETTPIKKKWGLRGLLCLSFMDVDVAEKDYKDAMQPHHADQVVEFVKGLNVETLVVHCLAGVSRSPSMAFAIAENTIGAGRNAVEWTSKPWHADYMDVPNKLVYRLTSEAFRKIHK